MVRNVSDLSLRNVLSAGLLMLVIAFTAVSCDGSWFKEQAYSQQSPAGIYTGFIRSTVTTPSPNRMVSGVFSEDFQSHLMAQDMFSQYAGVVFVEGDQLTGTLTEYLGVQARFFGFDGVRSIALAGTVSERDGISGVYTGEDEGMFGLEYSAEYESASALDLTTGIWTFHMSSSGGATYRVTLESYSDGTLFGTDTNGCVFSGSLGIIDERYNAYRATVTMSLCDPVNGEFAGLAYLSDLAGSTRLHLFFANDIYAFSTILSQ